MAATIAGAVRDHGVCALDKGGEVSAQHSAECQQETYAMLTCYCCSEKQKDCYCSGKHLGCQLVVVCLVRLYVWVEPCSLQHKRSAEQQFESA